VVAENATDEAMVAALKAFPRARAQDRRWPWFSRKDQPAAVWIDINSLIPAAVKPAARWLACPKESCQPGFFRIS